MALEASSIARPLLELLDEQGAWFGTSSELLTAIGRSRDAIRSNAQNVWPKNARSMSGHLKRLAPNLRASGWQVTFHREARQRLVVIERAEVFASPPAFASSPDDDGSMQSRCENDANRCPNDAMTDVTQLPVSDGPPREPNTLAWEEGDL